MNYLPPPVDVADNDDTSGSSILEMIWFAVVWMWSTAYQTLEFLFFGACAGNIEATVFFGIVSSTNQMAVMNAHVRKKILVQLIIFSIFMFYLHHALCYPMIDWSPMQQTNPPTTLSIRFITSTLWIQLSTIIGFLFGCAFLERVGSGWKNIHSLIILLSRVYQRILFQLYQTLVRLDKEEEGTATTSTSTSTSISRTLLVSIMEKATSSTIGALRMIVLGDLNMNNTQGGVRRGNLIGMYPQRNIVRKCFMYLLF